MCHNDILTKPIKTPIKQAHIKLLRRHNNVIMAKSKTKADNQYDINLAV